MARISRSEKRRSEDRETEKICNPFFFLYNFCPLNRIASFLLFFFPLAVVASPDGGTGRDERRTFPARIVKRVVEVRVAPAPDAAVIAMLHEGYRVRVVSRMKEYFRIELALADGRSRDGFVEKDALRFDSAEKGKGPSPSARANSNREKPPGTSGVALGIAPVFSLYRYGATQIRVGGAYTFSSGLGEIGIPLSYTFGSGFSSLSTGGTVAADLIAWKRTGLYARGGLLLERFSGNGRSFLGGTVEASFGIWWRWSPHVKVRFEPLATEAMVYATNGVPWNIRGETRVELKGEW
jgi:hypothetical protein